MWVCMGEGVGGAWGVGGVWEGVGEGVECGCVYVGCGRVWERVWDVGVMGCGREVRCEVRGKGRSNGIWR